MKQSIWEERNKELKKELEKLRESQTQGKDKRDK